MFIHLMIVCMLLCFEYFIQVLRKEHKIQGLSDSAAKVPSYVLNIYPPITIHNYLPYDVVYSVKVSQ